MAQVGRQLAQRPQQIVMRPVRLGESRNDGQHRLLSSEQSGPKLVVVFDDAEVAVQETAQAVELNAGGVGRRKRRQLADDRRACPCGAGSG